MRGIMSKGIRRSVPASLATIWSSHGRNGAATHLAVTPGSNRQEARHALCAVQERCRGSHPHEAPPVRLDLTGPDLQVTYRKDGRTIARVDAEFPGGLVVEVPPSEAGLDAVARDWERLRDAGYVPGYPFLLEDEVREEVRRSAAAEPATPRSATTSAAARSNRDRRTEVA